MLRSSDYDVAFRVSVDQPGGIAADVRQIRKELAEQDLIEIVMLFSIFPAFDPNIVKVLIHADELRGNTAIRFARSLHDCAEITLEGSLVTLFDLKEAQIDKHFAPASHPLDDQVTVISMVDPNSTGTPAAGPRPVAWSPVAATDDCTKDGG